MRKIFWLKGIFASVLAFALVFVTTGCQNNDDDDDDDENTSSSSSATLPSSVGTNEMSGKTWGVSETSNGETSSMTIAFADSTVTVTMAETNSYGTSSQTEIYNYTYDSSSNLLYLAYKSISFTDSSSNSSYTFTSVSDYKSYLSSMNLSGVELEKEVADFALTLATPRVLKYSISGSSLFYQAYFDGTMPSQWGFENSSISNVSYFEAESGRFKIKISSSTDEGKSYYYVYPTFSSDKTFTGDVYKRDADENYSKLGTATGVYTSSGAGTSGVTVSITFTSLPTGFTSYITTGEAYTLTADDSNFSGETLTQQ